MAFFSYSVNEALHLSAQEEEFMVGILKNIDKEIKSNIDKFTQDLIISHIDLLLKYSERFYSRQFITRKVVTNDVLIKLEQVLDRFFLRDTLSANGIPTVQQVASELNMSPNYLSDLLRSYTGLTTLQHIQNRIIEKSKELLLTTKLSVNEIAFALGFEHSQSFHRLFKSKIKQSPIEFRERFN
jgi:AraC-like DNA-binding protein